MVREGQARFEEELGSKLDSIADVGNGDVVGCLEVGEGAGDFDALEVGAGGEAIIISQLEQLIFDFGFERRKLFNFAGAHIGVADEWGGGKTVELAVSGQLDFLADQGRGVAGGQADELGGIDGLDGDMEVDPIKDGAGDAFAVAFNFTGKAAAGLDLGAEVAAGARIGGGHQ